MINKPLSIDGFAEISQTTEADSSANTFLRLLALMAISLVVAFGKKATMDMGIPGHSALLWLSAMIAGRAIVNRDGSGFAIGVMTAFWGVPVGLNNSLLSNVALYGLTGAIIDLSARFSLFNQRSAAWFLFCGSFAHMVKFAFVIVRGLLSVTAKRFLLFGVLKSAGLHLVFGIGAGLAAYGIYTLFQSGAGLIERRKTQSDDVD